MKKLSIASLKAKYPKLHLYYHDNGSWILYKKPPPENTYVGETAHDKLVLIDSEEQGQPLDYGYLPVIVVLLCGALGITTESE